MDKSVEEHYMGKVLELLIPLLSSEQATCSNHTLLSTTVILRMSEQFTDISHDSQRHLNGAASLFMDGTVWAGIETDLAVASFWTHLRESIRICFLNEQPCLMNLARFELWFEEGSFSASLRLSDELWTNRITYLLLKVCNLCWHQEPAAESPAMSRGAEVDKIKSLVRQWRDSLPASFTPWCARKGDNQPFPVVQCFDSWHGELIMIYTIPFSLSDKVQWWRGSSTTPPKSCSPSTSAISSQERTSIQPANTSR